MILHLGLGEQLILLKSGKWNNKNIDPEDMGHMTKECSVEDAVLNKLERYDYSIIRIIYIYIIYFNFFFNEDVFHYSRWSILSS